MSLQVNPYRNQTVIGNNNLSSASAPNLVNNNRNNETSEADEARFKEILEEYKKQNGPKVTISFLT